jgi:hypothetical protein
MLVAHRLRRPRSLFTSSSRSSRGSTKNRSKTLAQEDVDRCNAWGDDESGDGERLVVVLALSPIRRLVFGGRRLSICDRLFPVEYRADGP